MTFNQHQLYQVQRVSPRFRQASLNRGPRNFIKLVSYILVRVLKILEEMVLGRQIMYGHGHDNTNNGENDPVCRTAILESLPVVMECRLIDMPVDPVAVLEVIVNEPINDIQGWKHCEEVTIIFGGRGGKVVYATVLAVLAAFRVL